MLLTILNVIGKLLLHALSRIICGGDLVYCSH